MKICLLADYIPPRIEGGAPLIAWRMAEDLVKGGHEVIFITTAQEPHEAGVSQKNGITVYTLFSDYHPRWQAYLSLWHPSIVRQVRQIFINFKPDVVHAHNIHFQLSYGCLIVAHRLGAKTVLTCHDVQTFNYSKLTHFIDPTNISIPTTSNYKVSALQQLLENRFRYNPFRNFYIRWVLRKYVTQIVAVSDALKDALEQNGIHSVLTLHNGINAKEWEVAPEMLTLYKAKWKLGSQVILFAGRLSGPKGGFKIIEIFAEVLKRVPTAQLLVVGAKDELGTYVFEVADAAHVLDRTIFTGLLSGEALHAAFGLSSMVVVPSICFDSFPTVNLEAMASHKPVLATCFGGSRELVVDGQTGYIVNPYNIQDVAVKIVDLFEHSEKSAALGNEGYLRVAQQFTFINQMDKYKTLYRKLSR